MVKQLNWWSIYNANVNEIDICIEIDFYGIDNASFKTMIMKYAICRSSFMFHGILDLLKRKIIIAPQQILHLNYFLSIQVISKCIDGHLKYGIVGGTFESFISI